MKILRLALGIWLVCAVSSRFAFADAAEPGSPAPARFEEAKRRTVDLAAKLDSVAAVVDAEEAAGRIKHDDAEAQRKQIEAMRPGELFFPNNPTATANSSADANAALLRAWAGYRKAARELRQAWTDPELRDETIQRTVSIWRTAQTAKELAPAIDLFDEFNNSLPKYVDSFKSQRRNIDVRSFLQSSLALLRSIEAGDPQVFRKARSDFESSGSSAARDFGDREAWYAQLAKGLEKQIADLNAETNAAIIMGAANAKFLELADRADAIAAKIRVLKTADEPQAPPQRPTLPRLWSNFLVQFEAGNHPAAHQAAVGICWMQAAFTPEAWKVIEPKLLELRDLEIKETSAATLTPEQRWLGQLAKINDAEAASKLADQVTDEARAAKNPKDAAFVGELANDLRRVAAIWNGKPQPPEKAEFSGTAGPSAEWIETIGALSVRAARDAIATAAQAPELLEAPDKELPLFDAVRKLGHDLYAHEDWKRLYALLLHSRMALAGAGGADDESLQSLKTFLSAENLERAEQFSQAMEAYREIVASVGEFVPTEAAAKRLSVLRKNHPEAFPKERMKIRRAPIAPWRNNLTNALEE
ncbi:MAG TPA: hypothetical protein VGH90_13480 [Chthoniobacteraceae bacterium]|jgi:hypothetical protein